MRASFSIRKTIIVLVVAPIVLILDWLFDGSEIGKKRHASRNSAC
jgi:hypothetical protein